MKECTIWIIYHFRDFKDEEGQEELFKVSQEKYSDAPDASHKKTAQPSKLVSLGAAANYTGGQQQQYQQQKRTDEMTNLFGNVSVDARPTQQQQSSQFSDGGFADFESAFSSGLEFWKEKNYKYAHVFHKLQATL